MSVLQIVGGSESPPSRRHKETIKPMAQEKYKKQTEGHGQFGDCWRGDPQNFIPAVERSVS